MGQPTAASLRRLEPSRPSLRLGYNIRPRGWRAPIDCACSSARSGRLGCIPILGDSRWNRRRFDAVDHVMAEAIECEFKTIGGHAVPELAESPRQKIVRNTSGTLGPTTLESRENGTTVTTSFRNFGITLSATQLSLLRGQTAVLTTTVSGPSRGWIGA